MKRFIFLCLTFLLGAWVVDQAIAKSNENVSPQEKAKIEKVVHDYLISKPEVLMEAMQVLQQRQFEQAEQTVKETKQVVSRFANPLFHQPNDPVVGDPQGPVTVVEFFDYQCSHCIEMAPIISDLIQANPKVRFIFKEFPIRGPMSELAARAALAANKQGKYFAFSHALLTANKTLSQDVIDDVAEKSGVNVAQMKKDMNDPSITQQLKDNMKLAQDLKLFGTPAFFVGKTEGKSIDYIPGELSQAQLQQLIDKAE